MAVGVRFHHSQYFGGTDPITYDLCIVAQCASIDFSPTAIGLFHVSDPVFGVVMCGSRKYIGSSGGEKKLWRRSCASLASTRAEGKRTRTRLNCGRDSDE